MTITTVRLKGDAVELVKKSLKTKNRLQFELRISYLTLQRWLKANDSKLTGAHSLKIISEETGISQPDLLEEV